MTTLRYTIFYNINYVIGEIIKKPNNANIKYTIFRCEIDAGNIKYIKIRKIDQQKVYPQLEITVKQFGHLCNIIPT